MVILQVWKTTPKNDQKIYRYWQIKDLLRFKSSIVHDTPLLCG